MRSPRFVLVALLLCACGGGDNSSGIPDDCNPLGGQGCLLPWPSSTYLVEDGTTATGYRISIPEDAMPQNIDAVAIDPSLIGRWDGFSPVGPLLVEFPAGVSGANLPSFKDPSQSLAADSPIVLVDIDTGERAPFFAEIDQNIPAPHANLIIRPLARLHTGAHYAVGLLNTLTGADGSPLEPPAAFVAARDNKGFSHPRFAKMKAGIQDAISALETAGVDRSELVLAWDYRTASDQFLTGDLTAMVKAAIPAMGVNGSNLTFTATQQAAATGYASYLGTFKSPNFLTDGENDDSVLARDASGVPVMSGLRDANLAAVIPDCVTTMPLPRPTVIFGHGLFGSGASYIDNQFLQNLAQQYCMIILAGDFIGLTDRQIALAPLAVNDLNRAPEISEKLAQSIIDFMALETIARGPMGKSPPFNVNGTSIIDPANTFYIGGSLGGIMGNTFMAYDPNLTRAILAVPGGNWSLLFERSNAWSLLMGATMGAYPDPDYYQLNLAFFGMGMEPYDPITTAAHVIQDPLPGNTAKNVLMWYAIGDCLVTNIATEMVARTMGITMLAPSVKSPWGLTPVDGPLSDGIVVLDDHPTPLPPDTNVPPATDNGVHEHINYLPAPLRFANDFMFDDTIKQECLVDGQPAACDCATGACN
ncbi:MAG TPA: hypothetical protein VLX92_17795 [Kofleriaceae bacterium]|nr:hypothetical protein [Kofleriaceae bacterium]